ncbi:hypothetical protein AKO1_001021, partial [Acrasis kona]
MSSMIEVSGKKSSYRKRKNIAKGSNTPRSKVENKNQQNNVTLTSNNDPVQVNQHENITEIRKLLEPATIKSLQIFDFDATLFNTPCPEEGHPLYLKQTGNQWPHNGWWRCPESLMEPFNIQPGPAFEAFFQHIKLPNTHTIVMTGRSCTLKNAVINVLTANNALPASVVMKPDLDGYISTLHYKLKAIQEEADKLPNLEKILLWEDRFEHAERFNRTRIKVRGDTNIHMNVYYVQPDKTTLLSPRFNHHSSAGQRGRGGHSYRGRGSIHYDTKEHTHYQHPNSYASTSRK